MKRLNEKTNKPFKMQDVREDGYIFDCYITSVKQKNGYFKEMWRSPKGYKKKVKEFEYGMDTLVKGPKKPKYKAKGGMSKYYADGGYVITGRD